MTLHPGPDKPVYVTLQADLTAAVGEERVPRQSVGAKLIQVTGGTRDRQIFLRADKTVAYGHLMGVLNVLRDSGYLKVALVGQDSPDSGAGTGGISAQ